MKHYLILLSAILLLSCNNNPKIESAPLPHGLKLPPREMVITLLQRHSIDVTGYRFNLHITNYFIA